MGTIKKILTALCLCASCLTGCVPYGGRSRQSEVVQPPPPTATPDYSKGQASYIHIETQRAFCSGVVVGKSTILTAEHCFSSSKDKLVSADGVKMEGTIIAKDGHDHVLIRTSVPLKGYRIAKMAPKMPPPGTDLYFWGGPSSLREILRKGYVAGVWADDEGTLFTVIEMHTWHGDSGGAFFDKDGNVVTVLYGGVWEKQGEQYWDITIVQPLSFTPGQLSLIK